MNCNKNNPYYKSTTFQKMSTSVWLYLFEILFLTHKSYCSLFSKTFEVCSGQQILPSSATIEESTVAIKIS